MQVYDISAEDGAKPSFEFVQSAQYWEVPIAGQGQPENPVPAADGTTYQVHSHSHSQVKPQSWLHSQAKSQSQSQVKSQSHLVLPLYQQASRRQPQSKS